MSEQRHTFKPGDGASYSIGGDSYPYTVSRVSESGKTVWARRDRFRANGNNTPYSEGPKKGVFVIDDNAPEEKFTLRKNGHFRPAGSKCGFFTPGRSYAMDPHF